MKTVFITSFNPFVSRNILGTDVLKLLRQQNNLRVIIFVPDNKKKYFIQNFGGGNVIIGSVVLPKNSYKEIIFRFISAHLVDTARIRIKIKEFYAKERGLVKLALARILLILGEIRFIKNIFQSIYLFFVNTGDVSGLFNMYKPDILFATDIFHNADIYFLAEAKKLGVMSVGMVRSWDNITNKGLFRVKPDKLIVHNNIVREEAVKHESINSGDIFVSGLPQFDIYSEDIVVSRDIFFKRIGLNPNKKTILVAPHGKRFHTTDWELLEILKKKLNSEFQCIVRFPPNDTVEFNGFVPDERFFIERPGQEFGINKFNEREVKVSDSVTLANDLFHSDVVVNYGSTISIDAVAFDKPVVIVAFDGWEKLPYAQSVKKFLDYDHIKNLTVTGFCRIAHNESELIKQISSYLKDPSLDRQGRKLLFEEQICKSDGKSGRRIAEYIISLL